MTNPTLLVLAAGMGSRYGGLKQMDPVGPNGETIIDYSLFDARRAGFGNVVFVIRRDIETPFRNLVGSRFENKMPVKYVFQELDGLPPGFEVPAGRAKPWGTGHAILAAADSVQEPFAAINADDFYGARAFKTLADHLQRPDGYAMVGYTLRNTLSDFGGVARGVCRVDAGNFLKSISEITGIEKDGRGGKYRDETGALHALRGDETVSMNIWGFTPALFPHLRDRFIEFLKRHAAEPKSEFYIPVVINELVAAGRAHVKVLATPDSWFGVTYREDRPLVAQNIRNLVASGQYPHTLSWSG